ncbi:MAG: IS4 family transposase [Actinomycetota bacterium]|nr:IS4 family transposase [Actinomycetota bacterium]
MDLEVGTEAGLSLVDRVAVGLLVQRFPVELVDRVIDQFSRREQRVRQLPARLMFYFVLVLCMFPQESYRSAMRILLHAFGRGADGRPVPTAGAIGTARRRLGADPVETIVRMVTRPTATRDARGAWYQEWRLVALDSTTFRIPGTSENNDQFGGSGSGRGDGKGTFPGVRAACLTELGTHAVFDARIGSYRVSENKLVDEIVPALRPRMLVLADRGLYSFQRWNRAGEQGADLLWRVTSTLVLCPREHLSDGSSIAEAIAPKNSGTSSFRLRVIEYLLPDAHSGKAELHRLVTTILDPVRAPAKELAALYHEHWDGEGFFTQIKDAQLAADLKFRSKSPDGVRQEFWGHLAVNYATSHVAMNAARQATADPDRIAHKSAIRIIRSTV